MRPISSKSLLPNGADVKDQPVITARQITHQHQGHCGAGSHNNMVQLFQDKRKAERSGYTIAGITTEVAVQVDKRENESRLSGVAK